MTELERYKEALEKIMNNADVGDATVLQSIYTMAQEALNPPVEYEEVEVVQFCAVRDGRVVASFTTKEALENCWDCRGDSIVKLTGTYRRPVKPKVKRREVVYTPYDDDKTTLFEKLNKYPWACVVLEWEE